MHKALGFPHDPDMKTGVTFVPIALKRNFYKCQKIITWWKSSLTLSNHFCRFTNHHSSWWDHLLGEGWPSNESISSNAEPLEAFKNWKNVIRPEIPISDVITNMKPTDIVRMSIPISWQKTGQFCLIDWNEFHQCSWFSSKFVIHSTCIITISSRFCGRQRSNLFLAFLQVRQTAVGILQKDFQAAFQLRNT